MTEDKKNWPNMDCIVAPTSAEDVERCIIAAQEKKHKGLMSRDKDLLQEASRLFQSVQLYGEAGECELWLGNDDAGFSLYKQEIDKLAARGRENGCKQTIGNAAQVASTHWFYARAVELYAEAEMWDFASRAAYDLAREYQDRHNKVIREQLESVKSECKTLKDRLAEQ